MRVRARQHKTVAEAFLRPTVSRLVSHCEHGLDEGGFTGSFSIMKSNGGQMRAGAAASNAIQTVLSGLAGGIVAGKHFGKRAGSSNLITLDMGGTSADIGIAPRGEIRYTNEFELEWGLPISAPAIDLTTIGAGGGSIAWIDEGGLLQVGPRSAGAEPGPVCYGQGGDEVTVTDANLVLGRLDPDYFLGGGMRLNRDRALAAVDALAQRLRLTTDATASAIVELPCERMANAIRRSAIEHGLDPADFDLVAFGGAGPLHATAIALSLGSKRVIIPPHPGFSSAFGTLLAKRRVDRRWTQSYRSDEIELATVNRRLDTLAAAAQRDLRDEGFDGTAEVLRSISMRYVGQNYESELSLPPGALTLEGLHTVCDAFHAHHRDAYGFSTPSEPLELIHFNVTALGDVAPPEFPPVPSGPTPEPVSVRPVCFEPGERVSTSIYRRAALTAGSELAGPAIIEENDSTTLVPAGYSFEVSADGTLVLERTSSHALPEADSSARREIDSVAISIVHDQLVNITHEMGTHMMRSAYSPIFSESRDFSCALFNREGEMLAQGAFSPAHLGAIVDTTRCVLDELGPGNLDPGDVVLHNDPFRGGCHMPEHMLLKPVFYDSTLVAFAVTIGHLAEIGAMSVGSFASNATEVYQEGLRLPPVKIVRQGEDVPDLWKVILANHRTPRNSWGDLRAMVGSLDVGERRLTEVRDAYGADFVLETTKELLDHTHRLTKARIQEIPDGEYHFEDAMEDDGIELTPATMRVAVVVCGDELTIDFTGSAPQRRGPINATFGVTTSAAYNALFQIAGADLPRNAGAYRCVETIAPPGTVVNVAFPGSSVGGNTETQPKLVGMILGALNSAVPDRIMAAEGVTSCNFLFGGIHPETNSYYAHYHFEASGWGARQAGDGNSAQNHIHGNCRNTPVEVFETRFPFVVTEYGLIEDSGGPGRHRGGLATRRVMRVVAPELTASAMMDRVVSGAWGLSGGSSGRCAQILIKRHGDSRYRTFQEALGTVSPSKFSNVTLHIGDEVMLDSAGGGGYGDPRVRDPKLVLADVAQGLVSTRSARDHYGVVVSRNGGRIDVDEAATALERGASRS